MTNISQLNAQPTWVDSYPLPAPLDFYISLNLVSDNYFISLAPEDATGIMHVVGWKLGAKSVTFDLPIYDGLVFQNKIKWKITI